MRVALIALCFTAFAFAQASSAISPTACGPDNISFKVNLDESQHRLTQPDPGKAQIYFIHDAGSGSLIAYPTVKVALDGEWIGANHGNSYFSVAIDPGQHHICINLQSSLVEQRVELAHFTANADSVYYFRTRLVMSRSVELLELDLIDSDQGKYLIATFPLSISKAKK
jgi:hypothetical protein